MSKDKFRLVVVSGRSGSGKTTALHALEDAGFYCIDNLPASLLLDLIEKCLNKQAIHRLAIGIDARNMPDELKNFAHDFSIIQKKPEIHSAVVFLDASKESLLRRFNMTRRTHPMGQHGVSLDEAINEEITRLDSLSTLADIRIDTSQLSIHELRSLIRERIVTNKKNKMNVLFQSFGFKFGVPADADFVFDVRCLPNPYWIESLRGYTGNDEPVIAFLKKHQAVKNMEQDIYIFLQKWLSSFQNGSRSYMTVAIGCTGGRHRSVYLCERLFSMFCNDKSIDVMVQHREQSL